MQATNFLRAFSQLPEASRLELLDQTMATAFVPREGSDKVLILLALLVQKYKYRHRRSCRSGRARIR